MTRTCSFCFVTKKWFFYTCGLFSVIWVAFWVTLGIAYTIYFLACMVKHFTTEDEDDVRLLWVTVVAAISIAHIPIVTRLKPQIERLQEYMNSERVLRLRQM